MHIQYINLNFFFPPPHFHFPYFYFTIVLSMCLWSPGTAASSRAGGHTATPLLSLFFFSFSFFSPRRGHFSLYPWSRLNVFSHTQLMERRKRRRLGPRRRWRFRRRRQRHPGLLCMETLWCCLAVFFGLIRRVAQMVIQSIWCGSCRSAGPQSALCLCAPRVSRHPYARARRRGGRRRLLGQRCVLAWRLARQGTTSC